MSKFRTGALDSARRYLFDASWALAGAARVLVTHGHGREDDGTAEVGREAVTMSVRAEEMKATVRKVHEAAHAAGAQGDETTGGNR
jgi:DNA-nicking Smr family endonuclease